LGFILYCEYRSVIPVEELGIMRRDVG